MREKVRLEEKDGKVIAYYMGKKHTMTSDNLAEVKRGLEEDGFIVEFKE